MAEQRVGEAEVVAQSQYLAVLSSASSLSVFPFQIQKHIWHKRSPGRTGRDYSSSSPSKKLECIVFHWLVAEVINEMLRCWGKEEGKEVEEGSNRAQMVFNKATFSWRTYF